jgi:hypothetical protein
VQHRATLPANRPILSTLLGNLYPQFENAKEIKKCPRVLYYIKPLPSVNDWPRLVATKGLIVCEMLPRVARKRDASRVRHETKEQTLKSGSPHNALQIFSRFAACLIKEHSIFFRISTILVVAYL